MLPCFLMENWGSLVQFPGITLTGNEELATHEAYHVADGRRDPSDYWSAITPNTVSYLNYALDRSRLADMVALDRGHNLAGQVISLLCSNDNFATSETVFSCTLPAVAQPGGDIDDPLGAVTEEGAWLKRFSPRAALYWRFQIGAMGANLVPNIVGFWLGKAFYPSGLGDWMLNLPVSPDGGSLVGLESTSEAGWVGRGIQTPRKEGSIPLRLVTEFNYDLARYHLEAGFGMGRPMWIIFDDNLSERAFLAIRPQPPFGFRREQTWYFPQALVPYQEHEPLRP